MVISEQHHQFPAEAARQRAPVVAPDVAFETRWAAWVARGRAHERRARRKFAVWAGVFAVGAAIGYAFLG